MSRICKYFDRSKSWYYDTLATFERVREYEHMIVTAVQEIRRESPCYGIKKLWHALARQGIKIGRDRLHKILRKNGLTLPRNYKKVRTSFPGIYDAGFENKIKNLHVNRPNQVWCTDITYIHTTEGMLFMSAIMDLYSRKIVSYNISNNLKTEGALDCLNKALKQVSDPKNIIHHSDHGVQYCSYRYINTLQRHGLEISFTGKNHCYDNATMERFFNTLKHEYGLKGVVRSKKLAKELIRRALDHYNHVRLHTNLKYMIPNELYDVA
jgi:putative transposase